MKRRLGTIAVIAITILAVFISQVFAATEYYSNGKPSQITTDKGTITYFSNGNVDTITTPEGTASYYSDGKINNITGSPSISLEEAKSMLSNLDTPQTTSTTSTTTTATKLPNTGVEDYSFIILPATLLVVALLGYQAFKKIK